MKKGVLIAIIVILCIVAIIACVIYRSPNKNSVANLTLSEKIQNCPSDPEGSLTKNAGCITQLAIEYKNDSLCELISPSGGSLGWGPAHECVLRAFVSMGNPSNCGRLRYYSSQCEDAIVNGTPLNIS